MSDEETLESSSSDNESGQDDFEDPDFVAENVSDDDDDEQPGPSTAPTPTTRPTEAITEGAWKEGSGQDQVKISSPVSSTARTEL
ncbi:unnamed protein product [Coregonus sp. 'balchen']|nr:unnamed protein product [Coregonus sp. 'balchen']